MTPKILSLFITFLSIAGLIGAGCGDFSIYGSPPTADAGTGDSVAVGEEVPLDGNASDDEDGNIVSYDWAFNARPAGSAAVITDEDEAEATASFTPDKIGEYIIRLTVTDNDGLSDSATVTYTAYNAPVAIVADMDCENSNIDDTITLDGSGSTDLDGDETIASWEWAFFDIPDGSEAEITDGDIEEPTASFTPDLCGDYVIELTVTDEDGFTGTDTVTCTINCPPVADAGTGGSVAVGEEVPLDGSASDDEDGDIVSFAWEFVSRPDGSAAVIADETAETTSFTPDIDGDYVIELTVTDDGGLSNEESATVTYTASYAPVADVQIYDCDMVSQEVTLDGSASDDEEGDIVSFAWTFISRPDGSAAVIADETAETTSFTPDVCGDYVIELTVTDEDGFTGTDTETCTISCLLL